MHIERIQKAIETLEGVQRMIVAQPATQKNGFNMSMWGEKTECGTVACAAGWMVLDPWHHSQGLKQIRRLGLEPIFESERGSAALARYLEIQRDDAYTIFVEARAPRSRQLIRTPLDAANALRELLNKHSASNG